MHRQQLGLHGFIDPDFTPGDAGHSTRWFVWISNGYSVLMATTIDSNGSGTSAASASVKGPAAKIAGPDDYVAPDGSTIVGEGFPLSQDVDGLRPSDNPNVRGEST